ncbi:hypothetical protein PHYBLDRAFT_173965 [Phycomyces blakesleeanus NRRL 1555(-)]|uniref:Uncharacterized protein n=1 Tax=Phycomyces blakesleeanus (strain ATCC 8743b / DSM 1359 / FGSC 10004 / NBRC 33097 / NRRL 1555) TaxID=763407 RepID=A0A162NBI6_PHYB8|nr:hypothetical protein PHYBLDRAFT_173965 [Phycomyces blakesleeanus NRRL 1555(-)]OAD67634.1 hypothetical protein PHYBLDRAFT_173965 [Phycomyces blakesleeanus NRRL 1555(-)]|eukprot:XP_018285674.1 hypothetical protein PHYBLDRAFT_173965 [Phycomyces blakesleeanus NRRL 1555(-)]
MISVFRPFGPLVFCSFCFFFFIYKFSLFSLFPTFIIFTDFLDTRVLLPSDASPSQCPSGLAKAISPKLLSTIKHGYEHDEPPSHEHIANQELSFHTSVIDMIGEVYGSKQYKKKSLRLDKINSNTTKPCKNWHIHKLNNDILQQNVILSCRFSACGKNPYTENANTSYYPAVLTFSYVRKLVLPPMICGDPDTRMLDLSHLRTYSYWDSIVAIIFRLRDPKFRSNNAALIAANDSKSSWNTEIHFNRSPNKELTLALMAYLKPKFAAGRLRPSEIRSSIYTNFCGRCSAERKSPSALDAGRSRSRRASRATTNFDCHELAYSIYKADIDTLMGKDCEGLINKAAMSENESKDEIPGVPGNCVLCTVRPFWRSDEYNQFLEHVNKAMLRCLNLNVRQMAKKTFGRDADLAVPSQLKYSLPQWAFRDKL